MMKIKDEDSEDDSEVAGITHKQGRGIQQNRSKSRLGKVSDDSPKEITGNKGKIFTNKFNHSFKVI